MVVSVRIIILQWFIAPPLIFCTFWLIVARLWSFTKFFCIFGGSFSNETLRHFVIFRDAILHSVDLLFHKIHDLPALRPVATFIFTENEFIVEDHLERAQFGILDDRAWGSVFVVAVRGAGVALGGFVFLHCDFREDTVHFVSDVFKLCDILFFIVESAPFMQVTPFTSFYI